MKAIIWRVGAIALGLALAAVAFFSYELGISNSPNWGIGKLGGVAAGIGLLLIGLAWGRIGHAYSLLAVNLLNLVIVLGALEFGAKLALDNLPLDNTPQFEGKPYRTTYFEHVAWGAQFLADSRGGPTEPRYVPFTLWRPRPYVSQTINIDAQGVRRTPNARCDDANAFRVWVYGGSTVWGVLVPDSETIPAHLQRLLTKQLSQPVCVVNQGVSAWVLQQGLIDLQLRLQQGERPDLVIFYGGSNDTNYAYFNKNVAAHYLYPEFQLWIFNSNNTSTTSFFEKTYIFKLLQRLTTPAQSFVATGTQEVVGEADGDVVAFSAELLRFMQGQQRTLAALGAEYGFATLYALQPSQVISRKPLNDEERLLLANGPFFNQPLNALVSQGFKAWADEDPDDGVLWLVDIFDDVAAEVQIWFDPIHVTPEGNRIVAEALLASLPLR